MKKIADLIEKKAYSESFDLLLNVLYRQLHGKQGSTDLTGAPLEVAGPIFSNLASYIAKLFITPDFKLSKAQYLKGLAVRDAFHIVFALSNPQKLLQLLDDIIKDEFSYGAREPAFSNASGLYKFLLLINLQHAASIDIILLLSKKSVQAIYHVLLSLWSSPWELDAFSQLQKKRVASTFAFMADITPSIQSLSIIYRCLAKTAYMEKGEAEQIKPVLHQLILNYNKQKGLDQLSNWKHYPLKEARQKPRLVLIAECFWPGHVVHRCFHQLIAPLRETYEVIAVTTSSDYKNAPWSFCDRVITLNEQAYGLNLSINEIRQLDADVILYTSVGLRYWTLITAALRLAPVQLMLPGHPDSHQPLPAEIDYLVAGERIAETSHPKILAYQAPGSLYETSDLQVRPPGTKPPDKLHVAVCTNVFKLTFSMLDFLGKLEEEANGILHFELFLNTNGWDYLVKSHQIRSRMSNVTIHPSYQKNTYLQKLSKAHFLISTFPFGGENTVLDALSQGVPVFAVKGASMKEKLDARLLKSLPNLSDIALSDDVETLRKQILSIVSATEKLENYNAYLATIDLAQLFGEENKAYSNALLHLIQDLAQK